MKVLIAGYGFVGKAVAHALEVTYNLAIVDPKYAYSIDLEKEKDDISAVVVCIGTPEKIDGSCDTSQIWAFLNRLKDANINVPILIKSTIPPTSLHELAIEFPHICYSPEFLRAATSYEDMLNSKFIILGGAENDRRFWKTFWMSTRLFSSSGSNPQFYECSLGEASMIKYGINTFLALKVAYMNFLYRVCEKQGLEYNVVKEGMMLDSRIGTSHMAVPGPDGKFGFGGACFPKDTSALLHCVENELDLDAHILAMTIFDNDEVQSDPYRNFTANR